MSFFNEAKWIWIDTPHTEGVYVDFLCDFCYVEDDVELSLSCDTTCSVYLNGRLAFFGQYPDYPYYKIVEKTNITRYCKVGKNNLKITVWHCGLSNTQTYFPSDAGLIYEVVGEGGEVLSSSSEKTKARLNPSYRSGYAQILSPQLGQSFLYDATARTTKYSKAKLIEKQTKFYERPINDLVLKNRVSAKVSSMEDNRYLIDLGMETVGFPVLNFTSEQVQTLIVSFGEHIVDGGVRRVIENRDFSFQYIARKGRNSFINTFRRIGCRYLEVFCENKINIEYIGIKPVEYPLNVKKFKLTGLLKQRIYDTSVYTLKQCMHDHYEDCPWREQALYALDSRNQMLCGYYAFEEYKFARANLILLSKSLRTDGFLSICAPTGFDLPIPSFSLIYPIQVYEYILYSNDRGILDEVYPTVEAIMNNFISSVSDNGLIPNFGKPCWNFYEWSEGSDNWNLDNAEQQYDLILNCMFLYAYQYYKKLAEFRGITFSEDFIKMKEAINKTFFKPQSGIYKLSTKDNRSSQLGNAYAILAGVSQSPFELADRIISDLDMVGATLSMKPFVYDALLNVGYDYSTFILQDIEKTYGYMLGQGATTFWETVQGEADFSGAGSLCHGWSAMPVYYFNILRNTFVD